jgi:glycosyltransferase involved in cell wall biosynthesis
MRVLFLSDVYFPRVNGVSTSIRTFRADLAQQGVETLLVCPQYPQHDGDGEAGIVRIPSGAVPGDPEDRRMHTGALRRALDVLPAGSFDLVHVQTPFIAHYAGVRFALRSDLPCVATYHTFFEEYLHHYVGFIPRPLGATLARTFTRSQCRKLDAVVAPSQPIEDALRVYGVRVPISVVPTGMPRDRFAAGDGARFRQAYGIEGRRPLLGYVGRVAHEKNIEFLVESFAIVKSRLPEAALLIAGEGPARASLQQLAVARGLGNSVLFVGNLAREHALLDCFAAVDVFVFASRTETQGLVLLEAMAQGTPVLSTAALGTRSVLAPESGAVVVEERAEEFAAAATVLLTDAAGRERRGALARDYARTWASSAMATRLLELYRRVAPCAQRRSAVSGRASLSAFKATPQA